MPDEIPRRYRPYGPSAQDVIRAQVEEFHRTANEIFARQTAEFHRIFSQIPTQARDDK